MTELFRLILYFFVYSFLGWCAEVAFAAVTLRKLVNRGFLNGPLCPIYGFGMVALLVALGPLVKNSVAVFTVGAVLSTLIELFGGWVLYRLFHARWWDYSDKRWNVGGFVCPQFTLLWGLGSLVMIRLVHPLLAAPVERLPHGALLAVDGVLLVVAAVDAGLSFAQAAGFARRLRALGDLGDKIRSLSDVMTTHIGTGAMTIDTLLDEQRLQLMLAAMEGRENAAALYDQVTDLAGRAKLLRAEVDKRRSSMNRLLRAFPHMQAPHQPEALTRLRGRVEDLQKQRRGR